MLTVLLSIAHIGCSERGPKEFPPRDGVEKRTKLVLLAVDGMEPKLLDTFLSEGRLPVLQRLIENGTQSTIRCVAGTCSPVVWTTVVTGVMPEVHGITGFTVDDVPATSTLRRVPAFWNILDACGISSTTLGWQVSWPAEKASGIIITDRAYWGDFSDKTVPSDVLDLERYGRKRYTDYGDLTKFTSFPFDEDYDELSREDPVYAPNFLIKRRLMDAYVRDTIYTDMTMEVVQRYNPEVVAVYLYGIDYAGHGFWKWFESDRFLKAGWSFPAEETAQLKDVIPRYYEYTDFLVGRLLDYIGGDPLVILLSDHGFGPIANMTPSIAGEETDGPATLGDFITGNHREKAVFIASGRQVKKGAKAREAITHLDILPTLLHALGFEPPAALTGRVLEEFFVDDFKSPALPLPVEIADRVEGEVAPKRSEHDDAILENLKSLGYIK
jgi:hypothetical protein